MPGHPHGFVWSAVFHGSSPGTTQPGYDGPTRSWENNGMGRIRFGGELAQESITFDISNTGAAFFCSDAAMAANVLRKLAESVDTDVPFIFAGDGSLAPKGREAIKLSGGVVPGLDLDPDQTARMIWAAMESSEFNRPPSKPLARHILMLATMRSKIEKISFMAALDKISTFAKLMEGLTVERRSDDTHAYDRLLHELLSTIPFYLPSVGLNQRKEVQEAYEVTYLDIEWFRVLAGKKSVRGMNLNFDWKSEARMTVQEAVSRNLMIVLEATDFYWAVHAIETCCRHLDDTRMVILSGPKRTGTSKQSTYGITADRPGGFSILATTVFVLSEPAVLSEIKKSVHEHGLVFVADAVVLPYESMKTLDPHAFEHFGKGRSDNAYAEAAMQMDKIGFLGIVRSQVYGDATARQLVENEIESAKSSLATISKFIARGDRKPPVSKLIHVIDRKTDREFTILRDLRT
jgi:hypothetical protein